MRRTVLEFFYLNPVDLLGSSRCSRARDHGQGVQPSGIARPGLLVHRIAGVTAWNRSVGPLGRVRACARSTYRALSCALGPYPGG